MILIISEEDDSTTDRVISWLKYYQIDFVRINNTNNLDFELLEMDEEGNINGLLKDPSVTIELKKIKGYWYRRGKIAFRVITIGEQQLPGLMEQSNNFLLKEYDVLAEMVYHYFHSLELSVGNIYENKTNKLVNLKIASDCGMLVPKTWIFTRKKEVMDLLEVRDKLLTKPITQGGLYFEDDQIYFDGFSNLVDKEKVEQFSETFAATLFQEYIEKAYELRIFYFLGEIYASAIFSQLDEMTKTDFRNYNYSRPNRTPPCKLPEEVAGQIRSFMQRINMKSGSLDVLVTPDKKYYFLEVNPIGQFYQVSHPCNYYLEKRIAQYFNYGRTTENHRAQLV